MRWRHQKAIHDQHHFAGSRISPKTKGRWLPFLSAAHAGWWYGSGCGMCASMNHGWCQFAAFAQIVGPTSHRNETEASCSLCFCHESSIALAIASENVPLPVRGSRDHQTIRLDRFAGPLIGGPPMSERHAAASRFA